MTVIQGPVEFDLDREEIPVNLKQPGTKDLWECVLKEMDGHERDLYLNSQRNKVESKSQNIRDYSDVQTSLISQCLYVKATNERVALVEVRKFPAKVQMKLYELCMTLNGFDTKAEEIAKNV